MPSVTVRFYQELNGFLRPKLRFTTLTRRLNDSPAVKDVIESFGVPHTEVDLILVNGESVGFRYQVHGGERIAVYPVFEAIDIAPVQRLRPAPLRDPRFVVDVNVARLARLLRLLGFDADANPVYTDARIVEIGSSQKRVILTRDRGLLMRRAVTHGLWVRSDDPKVQVVEVLRRLDLTDRCAPFTRCLACNGVLYEGTPDEIRRLVPPRSREIARDVMICDSCGRAYWKGTHYPRLKHTVDTILRLARAPDGGRGPITTRH